MNEREAFDAWAGPLGADLAHNYERGYLNPMTRELFACWQASTIARVAALSRLRDTQRVLVEALRAYANVHNWDVDEQGIRRAWLEPDGYPRTAYNGFEAARAALASVEQPEQPYPTPAGDEEVTARATGLTDEQVISIRKSVPFAIGGPYADAIAFARAITAAMQEPKP